MQQIPISVQIALMEIKAKYAHLIDELEAVFPETYLSETGVKQKLALQMMLEIEETLAFGDSDHSSPGK